MSSLLYALKAISLDMINPVNQLRRDKYFQSSHYTIFFLLLFIHKILTQGPGYFRDFESPLEVRIVFLDKTEPQYIITHCLFQPILNKMKP